MEVFVGVEKILKIQQAHNKTNAFYFCFENAESSASVQSKTNNMDFLGHYLLPSLQDVGNLADKENYYIPGCDSIIFWVQ